MIYRIFPNKDTFITNYRRSGVHQTGSNLGSSEILHVFKQTAVTSSISASLSRILARFPVENVQTVTGSEYVTGSVSYRLKLRNAQHAQTLPTSYTIQIQAVSQDWDEGNGHDTDNWRDKGVANWVKAKSNVWWDVPGASGSGPIVFSSFDTGEEDLDVDVTPIVNAWLTGGLPNYGFLISLSGTMETDNNDYYVKMFHSRESFWSSKRPVIEAQWNDALQTGSIALFTGSDELYVDIKNLKNQYQSDEIVRLRLYVRRKDYNPAVVLTASSDATGFALANAYWRITNDKTEEVVVPFGTGSNCTKLSYDDSGNYFKLYMNSLAPGEVYRIAFIFDVDDQRKLVDENFKFRLVD